MSKRRTVKSDRALKATVYEDAEQEKVMALFSPKQQKMIKQLKVSQIKSLPPQQDVDKPLVVSAKPEEDVLDWDYYLKDPPFNPATIIEVEIKYGGRSKPIPVTDPWDE